MTQTAHVATTRAQVDGLFRDLLRTERTFLRRLAEHPEDLRQAVLLAREAIATGSLGQLLPTAEPASERALALALLDPGLEGNPVRSLAAFRACRPARITRKALALLAAGSLAGPVREALQATLEARNRLVSANEGLVVRRVEGTLNRGEGGVCKDLHEEALQEASLALQGAVDRFQPRLGFAFSTYAMAGIDAAIREARIFLNSNIRVSDGERRKWKAILDAEHLLTGRLKREPRREELAEALGMSLEELEEVQLMRPSEASLDAAPDAEEGPSPALDLSSDLDQASSLREVHRGELREVLHTALGDLPAGQAEVIRLRWGLEDGLERTRPQVASSLKLALARVAQLEAKGLERLKGMLGIALAFDARCL